LSERLDVSARDVLDTDSDAGPWHDRDLARVESLAPLNSVHIDVGIVVEGSPTITTVKDDQTAIAADDEHSPAVNGADGSHLDSLAFLEDAVKFVYPLLDGSTSPEASLSRP
jgi:hypothetical protein